MNCTLEKRGEKERTTKMKATISNWDDLLGEIFGLFRTLKMNEKKGRIPQDASASCYELGDKRWNSLQLRAPSQSVIKRSKIVVGDKSNKYDAYMSKTDT